MDVWAGVTWRHIEDVRAALEAGADVNARIGRTQAATPLLRALAEGTPEVVELLLASGADVEAAAGDWTPLWEAVRGTQMRAVDRPEWRREKVRLLLRFGADPWRPAVGGRSAGEVALFGPLADLFDGLPGRPSIPASVWERQAQADALIGSYAWVEPWSLAGMGVAFIAAVPADEVIRRLDAGPRNWPRVDQEGLSRMADDLMISPGRDDRELLWLDDVRGGTVIVQWGGYLLTRPEVAAPMSRDGLLVSTFAGGGGAIFVHVAREGRYLRWTEPIHDPGSGMGFGEPFEEERWCRFGDRDGPAGSIARCMAFMTLLTGIRVDEDWLVTRPKRAVVASPPRPAA